MANFDFAFYNSYQEDMFSYGLTQTTLWVLNDLRLNWKLFETSSVFFYRTGYRSDTGLSVLLVTVEWLSSRLGAIHRLLLFFSYFVYISKTDMELDLLVMEEHSNDPGFTLRQVSITALQWAIESLKRKVDRWCRDCLKDTSTNHFQALCPRRLLTSLMKLQFKV